MSYRRSLLGLVAFTAFALSACSGTSSTGAPSAAIPSVPASIGTGDLQGFGEDFAGTIASDWPDIDQSTASELSSVVAEWSTNPRLNP